MEPRNCGSPPATTVEHSLSDRTQKEEISERTWSQNFDPRHKGTARCRVSGKKTTAKRKSHPVELLVHSPRGQVVPVIHQRGVDSPAGDAAAGSCLACPTNFETTRRRSLSLINVWMIEFAI